MSTRVIKDFDEIMSRLKDERVKSGEILYYFDLFLPYTATLGQAKQVTFWSRTYHVMVPCETDEEQGITYEVSVASTYIVRMLKDLIAAGGGMVCQDEKK